MIWEGGGEGLVSVLNLLFYIGAAKQSTEDREAKGMMDSPLPISSS